MNWKQCFINSVLVVLFCAILLGNVSAQSAWQLYRRIYEDSPHLYESTDARDYDFAVRLSPELVQELLEQCEIEIDYGNYERVADMLHAIGVAGEFTNTDYSMEGVIGLVEGIESRARNGDARSATLLPVAYRMLARIDEDWSNKELRRRCETKFWEVAGPIEAGGGAWGREDARLAALCSVSLLARGAEIEIVELARQDYIKSGQYGKAELMKTILESSDRRAAEHGRRVRYSQIMRQEAETETSETTESPTMNTAALEPSEGKNTEKVDSSSVGERYFILSIAVLVLALVFSVRILKGNKRTHNRSD